MRLKTLGSHNIRQKVGECSEPGRTKRGGGQSWSHPSLFFLPMATMVQVLRDPTDGK